MFTVSKATSEKMEARDAALEKDVQCPMSRCCGAFEGSDTSACCAQVTLNSAKMHHDVGGDANRRLLDSMREMLDSDEMPEPPQNGKPYLSHKTSLWHLSWRLYLAHLSI